MKEQKHKRRMFEEEEEEEKEEEDTRKKGKWKVDAAANKESWLQTKMFEVEMKIFRG